MGAAVETGLASLFRDDADRRGPPGVPKSRTGEKPGLAKKAPKACIEKMMGRMTVPAPIGPAKGLGLVCEMEDPYSTMPCPRAFWPLRLPSPAP